MRLGGVGGIAARRAVSKFRRNSAILESIAESCTNDETAYSTPYYLHKARVPFLKTYGSKPARQADIRDLGSA